MGPPKNAFKTFRWHWAWRQQSKYRLEKLDITNNTLTGSNRQGREILQKLHNFCVRGDIAKVFQIYKWNKKELRKWRLLTVTYIANTGYLILELDQFLTNQVVSKSSCPVPTSWLSTTQRISGWRRQPPHHLWWRILSRVPSFPRSDLPAHQTWASGPFQ